MLGKSSSRQGHRSEDTREILAVQTIACRKLGVREHHVDNTRCNPSPRLDKRTGEEGPVKSTGSLRFATGMCLVQRKQPQAVMLNVGITLSMRRASSAWDQTAPASPCLSRAGHQGSSRRTLGPPLSLALL